MNPAFSRAFPLILGSMTVIMSAGSPAQAAPAPPGACWAAIQASTPSNLLNAGLQPYCSNLRSGTRFFEAGQFAEAMAAYERAGGAARAIPDAQTRLMAEDESRGARALILEAMGDAAGAKSLLGAPPPDRRDTLALLRGFFLARQALAAEAITALDRARTQLPEYWCDGHDHALAALKGQPVAPIDPQTDISLLGFHYLPSYLYPAQDLGGCFSKSQIVSLPTGRAYAILFDLGSDQLADHGQNQLILTRMAETLRALNRTHPLMTRWDITGHTDQSCPDGTGGQRACQAYNLALSERRAKAVVAALRARLGASDIRLIPHGMGMLSPLIDRGYGIEEARNRRVELSLSGTESTAAILDCPWQVQVYEAGLPVAGGANGVPGLTIPPDLPPIGVSRAAGYDIRYQPQAGGPWRYFQAVSETSDLGKNDLIQDGGLPGGQITDLRQGGNRLPAAARGVFRMAATGTTETLILSVSTTPFHGADALTLHQSPEPAAIRPDTVEANAAPLPPHWLIASKGPTGFVAPGSVPPDIVFHNATGPAAPAAVAQTAPAAQTQGAPAQAAPTETVATTPPSPPPTIATVTPEPTRPAAAAPVLPAASPAPPRPEPHPTAIADRETIRSCRFTFRFL